VAQDTSAQSKFQQYLAEIYRYPKKLENYSLMSLHSGVSKLSIAKNFQTKLAPSFNIELRYGFIRFNEEIDAPGRVYMANEYIYLQSNSSGLKPKSWEFKGIPTDAWRFGFAFRNGYGFVIGKNQYLTFDHTGALNWSRIDVEWPSLIERDQKKLNIFDETFRFGTEFESGISYSITNFMQASIAYNHSVVMHGINLLQVALSSTLELSIQRTIDYLAYEYIWQNPNETPYANFIAKSLVSYLIYELRRYNQNWPFKSKEPLSYDSFYFGVTFVF